jgi:uncharacterized protein YjbJ (UPF0337 family)
VVAEVLLDVAANGGRGVGRKGTAVGIETVRGLHQGEVRDLHELLELHPSSAVVERVVPGQGQVLEDELVERVQYGAEGHGGLSSGDASRLLLNRAQRHIPERGPQPEERLGSVDRGTMTSSDDPRRPKETPMGFDDKMENKGEDLKGKAKEATGKATDDEELEAEGKTDQVKSDLKDAKENVKDAFKN